MTQYAAYALVNGKHTDYNTAQKTLATQVEMQMIQGWVPQGGVIYIGNIAEQTEKGWAVMNFVFCQAMIKPASIEQGTP